MRRSLLLASLMVATAACDITEQRNARQSEVVVEVQNPFDLTFDHPLRYAVLWTLESNLVLTADEPLPTTSGSFQVVLNPPPTDVREAAVPQELMQILAFGELVPVYRPRIVIYSDEDENGIFDPNLTDRPGVDEIVAIDDNSSPSLAAVSNLDEALKVLSLDEANIFYQSTGQRFTPFVRVFVDNRLVLVRGDPGPVELSLSDSPIPRTRLECGRDRVAIIGSGLSATLRASAVVDMTLDAGEVCGGGIVDCQQVDLSASEPPDLVRQETDGRLYIPQCRTGSQFEVLVLHEAIRVCEPCRCDADIQGTAYYIDPASPPPWWPCGDTVEICASDLPLYTLEPACVLDDEEEEEEGT